MTFARLNRRRFLKSTAASAALLAAPAILSSRAALAADPIGIGSIHDLSGGLEIYGKPMVDALTLAIEETNAGGGLLGQQLKLVNYDAQSNMQLYPQYAQDAALKEKVAVVMGGITSAAREVMRPVLNRFKTLYFYNTQYEGGVCDRNHFATGTTPSQQSEKLVPYAVKRWGKKIYIVAADYNYGQITSDWVRKYAKEAGGEVVGAEFFPLDVTNFGPTIAKIQAAKPDLVFSVLVGGAHMSFYRQWAAAGMAGKIPMASTTFGAGNEHIALSAAEGNGIVVAYNYFEEVDTPASKDFVARFRKRFGADYPYVTNMAADTYQGFQLWAEAVKQTKTVERDPVIAALEKGISIAGPSGKVTIDPPTHHCILDIHLAELQNKKFKVLQSFPQQKPSDTGAVCDLIKNPADNQQYNIKL